MLSLCKACGELREKQRNSSPHPMLQKPGFLKSYFKNLFLQEKVIQLIIYMYIYFRLYVSNREKNKYLLNLFPGCGTVSVVLRTSGYFRCPL